MCSLYYSTYPTIFKIWSNSFIKHVVCLTMYNLNCKRINNNITKISLWFLPPSSQYSSPFSTYGIIGFGKWNCYAHNENFQFQFSKQLSEFYSLKLNSCFFFYLHWCSLEPGRILLSDQNSRQNDWFSPFKIPQNFVRLRCVLMLS